MRVAVIIAAHEEALETLIQGGFEPLANPVMRFALAHTVNLEQAFRMRGLSDEDAAALTARLLALEVDQGGR